MSVQFEDPIFDEQKRGYCFRVASAPPFSASVPTTGPYSLPADCSGNYLPFFQEFLKQAAQYFSRPLTLPVFCSRVHHIWSDHDVPVLELDKVPFVNVRWSPAEIWFFQFRYEIHWTLLDIRPGEAALPTSSTPSQTIELEPPQEEEIPFRASVSETDQTRRERLKKKIRKARLRALLTQLRAEKMAEQFYLRYGEASLDDSDSDVSFDSEQETGKI